jgi:hypothetical protein
MVDDENIVYGEFATSSVVTIRPAHMLTEQRDSTPAAQTGRLGLTSGTTVQ